MSQSSRKKAHRPRLMFELLEERTLLSASLVSVNSAGTAAGDKTSSTGGLYTNSVPGALSADGRYILFGSWADDLVSNDSNRLSDVFRRDLQTGSTALVSVNSTGTASGNSESLPSGMSADGRYVLFDSLATDLVAGFSPSASTDQIYVRDMQLGVTTPVSVTADGKRGNGSCGQATISADGHMVAFVSSSSDLVANDTNGTDDVFVRDLTTGITTLASVNNDKSFFGSGHTIALSGNGRVVSFITDSAKIVGNDTNGVNDLFVHDMATGVTSLVTINYSGTASENGMVLGDATLSYDGRYIAFNSYATDLVAHYAGFGANVYERDLQTGTTSLVSVSLAGTESADHGAYAPSISADGRFVAFGSPSSNLVANPDTNQLPEVYVRDMVTGVTSLVSQLPSAAAAGALISNQISGNGRYVVFASHPQSFFPHDPNGQFDLFLRDLVNGTTTRLTEAGNGSGQPVMELSFGGMSADGRVFEFDTNYGFVAADNNSVFDVYAAIAPDHVIQLGTTSYQVRADGGSATITVTRTGDPATTSSVQYATGDGTATANSDYTAASGTLTFASGETSKTFSVPILPDQRLDGDESVMITLSNPDANDGLGVVDTAILTILNTTPLPPPSQLGAAANGITHTIEHYTQFVTSAYQTYQGRAPDQAGLNSWVAAMQNGLSDEQLEAGFIASPEYIANHGGQGAAWVRSMYQDILGRAPSQGEVDGWVQALNSGVSPQSVAYGFAASAEREGNRIRGDYQTFLGRTPSPSEVDGWVNDFVHGRTNEGLVAGFLASPEYYHSAAKGKGDNLDWIKAATQDELQRQATTSEINTTLANLTPVNLAAVANLITHTADHYRQLVTNAFQVYLGRAPDQTGLDSWVRAMQNGLTDEQLEAGFIASQEYIANHGGQGAGWVRGMYQDILGRTPAQVEVDGWVQALNSGVSPQSVAYGFAASAEREGKRVRGDYQLFLGRTPAQSEIDGWVNDFLHGLTNEGLVAGFLGSIEYFNSPTKGKSDKTDWVRSAVLDELGRSPTDDDFNTWGNVLQ